MPTYVEDYTALVRGRQWSTEPGLPAVVTYSFDTEPAGYFLTDMPEADALSSSFQAFTPDMQELARDMLDVWDAAAGITFVEVAPGTGDIRFSVFDFDLLDDPRSGIAYAYYPYRDIRPGESVDSDVGGDVFINVSRVTHSGLAGSILHEIGHAIGLQHPHDRDIRLTEDYDTGAYTVMSYNRSSSQTTLGSFDEQALEHIYGPDTFVPNASSGLQQFTVDAGALSSRQVWGNAASQIGGSGLADAILAGGGDDTVAGFAGNDTLQGGPGDDELQGGPGRDLLDGGPGADILRGEEGIDAVSYGGEAGRVLIDLQSDVGGAGFARFFAAGAAEGDRYFGIENALGGNNHDQLRGNAEANRLAGGTGWDRLYGRQGDDTLSGDAGGDAIFGNAGADMMTGGDGNVRDRFIYFSPSESGVGPDNRDIITDFQEDFDRIEISRFDADLTTGGKQRFDFIGAAGFSNTAGELRYTQVGLTTLVQADLDGDARADFEIALWGGMDLTADNFLI